MKIINKLINTNKRTVENLENTEWFCSQTKNYECVCLNTSQCLRLPELSQILSVNRQVFLGVEKTQNN